MTTYTYLGDRLTDPDLKRASCTAVLDERGKCIRGKNGSMLVQLADGRKLVVIGHLLRKIAPDVIPSIMADVEEAVADLQTAERIKALLTDNSLACVITIGTEKIGLAQNAWLLPVMDQQINEIVKFLNNEPNEWE
ncbi:hypothetical protein FAES_3222 [Fibrella aestuarina BUZ 2]|uniref:Uncharacterized protein n=1 Tax=Fibrella aestuarina BUZ 2 TaxID=1166018 RepID=I0KAS8_9BACT|nr:hypothetical protein [Fibrella aestuarina]CCH01231.1 hypothetical protein FAES_3222 [Fibrella aestuarina BUZ 2]